MHMLYGDGGIFNIFVCAFHRNEKKEKERKQWKTMKFHKNDCYK